MITQKTKSTAVAYIKSGYSPEEVAEKLSIPKALIMDWNKELSMTDMVAVEANIIALERITKGEIVPIADEKILENTIIETATALANQASIPGVNGDLGMAQSIKLCAGAIAQLYEVIVLKGKASVAENVSTHPNLQEFYSSLKD